MREILFRGKTKQGKWVEGGYFKTDNESYIIKNTDGVATFDLWDFAEFVIPETIGQYTGLTDKNGKKIFEGDIIEAITLDEETKQRAFVGFGVFVEEYSNDEFVGFYIEFDGIKATITQLLMEEVKGRFEVIGNIHDNPELLGV